MSDAVTAYLIRAEHLAPWLSPRIENVRGAFKPGGCGDVRHLAWEVEIAQRRKDDGKPPLHPDLLAGVKS